MELINLKCPQCGANLQVNGSLSQVFCNYCGAKISIPKPLGLVAEDAKELGFQFERGRMEAHSTTNKELANRIKALIPHLSKIDRLGKESQELMQIISNLETECEKKRSKRCMEK